MLEIGEPVNVWVFFKKSTVQPLVFFWKGREIKIDSIDLVHSSKIGSTLLYHYSVSAQGNFYRLVFDLGRLKWFLEAVEESD